MLLPTPELREDEEATIVRRRAPSALREPTRVEVNLDAVVDNLRFVKTHVGLSTGVLAVIKADAYGHGLLAVARALDSDAALAGFVVTTPSDALRMREAGIASPIVVMTASYGGLHDAMLGKGVTPVVATPSDLMDFARAAGRRRGRASVHVEIDTGMSRAGIREDALEEFLALADQTPQLTVAGLCTHLASADHECPAATTRQLDAFERACEAFRRAGHAPKAFHASNTAATFRHPRSHLTHVRTGIALFGGDEPSGVRLRPALRFVTHVVDARSLRAGDTVSYGGRWQAPRASRVATLPVGYSHGYPRRLFERGEAIVRGRRCPIVGAICMESMMVDVTELGSDVTVGDEVVLLGGQGNEEVTAADLAARADTIVEDIYCGISRSVPRRYAGPSRVTVQRASRRPKAYVTEVGA